MKTKYKTAHILSIIILCLTVLASAGGLFIPGIYRDHDIIKKAWFGNDIVTLFIVAPLFFVSLVRSSRGSQKAELVWLGLLGYMLYNFAFYLFGTAFNELFLVYVSLFTLSIYTLGIGLWNLDVYKIKEQFGSKTPVRLISLFLIVLVLPLCIIEIGQSLNFVLTGKYPEAPTLIFALDLSFVVPNMIVAAILLWKRVAWGYILSMIMLVKGFTYGMVLIASTESVAGFSLKAKWDPLIIFFFFVFIGSLIAGLTLLRHFKNR